MTYDTGPLSGKPVPGLIQQGNIDLNHRPKIVNQDGSVSSIFSVTIPVNKDGSPWKGKYENAPRYALVPSIADGKFLYPGGKMPRYADKPDSELTPQQRKQKQRELSILEDAATEHYDKTRQYLGIFKTGDDADRYADKTHAYVSDGSERRIYTPSY